MKKLALAWMKLKVMFFECSKHFLHMMHVISQGEVKNNGVIDIKFGKTKIL
jgi:hypothetical protein